MQIINFLSVLVFLSSMLITTSREDCRTTYYIGGASYSTECQEELPPQNDCTGSPECPVHN